MRHGLSAQARKKTRAAPPAHGALRRIISVMCKWPRSAKDAL